MRHSWLPLVVIFVNMTCQLRMKLKMKIRTPAGTDEHPLTGRRVRDGAVVMDEGRVKGDAVHIQRH